MPNGQVDIRLTERTGKYRLRFHAVAADHLETIKLALYLAREMAGTQYDSVALDAICQSFLGSHSGNPTTDKFVPGQTL